LGSKLPYQNVPSRTSKGLRYNATIFFSETLLVNLLKAQFLTPSHDRLATGVDFRFVALLIPCDYGFFLMFSKVQSFYLILIDELAFLLRL